MAQYSTKPVVVDALQWTGTNDAEMTDFLVAVTATVDVRWSFTYDTDHTEFLLRNTHQGDVKINSDDWVIFETDDLHKLDSAEFDATYEVV